jgi:ribosomal protein L29
MGRSVREDEISELLSLGVDMTKIRHKNKNELEERIDDVKQAMIREFRMAYSLKEKENEPEIESVSSI